MVEAQPLSRVLEEPLPPPAMGHGPRVSVEVFIAPPVLHEQRPLVRHQEAVQEQPLGILQRWVDLGRDTSFLVQGRSLLRKKLDAEQSDDERRLLPECSHKRAVTGGRRHRTPPWTLIPTG